MFKYTDFENLFYSNNYNNFTISKTFYYIILIYIIFNNLIAYNNVKIENSNKDNIKCLILHKNITNKQDINYIDTSKKNYNIQNYNKFNNNKSPLYTKNNKEINNLKSNSNIISTNINSMINELNNKIDKKIVLQGSKYTNNEYIKSKIYLIKNLFSNISNNRIISYIDVKLKGVLFDKCLLLVLFNNGLLNLIKFDKSFSECKDLKNKENLYHINNISTNNFLLISEFTISKISRIIVKETDIFYNKLYLENIINSDSFSLEVKQQARMTIDNERYNYCYDFEIINLNKLIYNQSHINKEFNNSKYILNYFDDKYSKNFKLKNTKKLIFTTNNYSDYLLFIEKFNKIITYRINNS